MKFYLCHVPVRKYRRQKHNVKGAMIVLDIKIKSWINLIPTSDKYTESRYLYNEYSEIMGELKFLYQSDILSAEEYQQISNNLYRRYKWIIDNAEEEPESDDAEAEEVQLVEI